MSILFHVQYAVLFEIVLLHDYSSTGCLDRYQIMPTPECRKLMRQYRLLSKMVDNRFVVLIEMENGVPKTALDKNLRFTFSLHIPDPYFCNYTNIDLLSYRKKVLYFSNSTAHSSTGLPKNPLTQPIEAYKSGKNIRIGDIISHNDALYEAAVESPHKAPQSDSKEWISYEKNRIAAYCTIKDLIPLISPTTLLQEYPDFEGTLNNQVDAAICPTKATSQNIYSLNGLYNCKIGKHTSLMYISSLMAQEPPLGIIEIFHNTQLPAGQQLIDADQKLLSPSYSIAFKNRSTWWRYILRGKNAEKIYDKDDKYRFVKISDKEFVSEMPIPLCQNPIRSLALTLNGIGTVNTLPNPTTQQIIPQNGKLFSNIYLNY